MSGKRESLKTKLERVFDERFPEDSLLLVPFGRKKTNESRPYLRERLLLAFKEGYLQRLDEGWSIANAAGKPKWKKPAGRAEG